MSTYPTKEELEAKTRELLALYLKGIIASFTASDTESVADKINDAINFRGMLINEPDKGNIATLADVADQFDAQGNVTKATTFTYHNPDRAKSEIKYLIGDKKSDRENIAFTSVYFKQGSQMLDNNRMVAFAPKLGDVLRPTVANVLREKVGFTEPNGYTPHPDFISKVNSLLEENNFKNLVETILDNYKIIPDVTKAGREAKDFAEGHLAEQLNSTLAKAGIDPKDFAKGKVDEKFSSTPLAKKADNIVQKQSFLQRTSAAANDFAGSCDPEKFTTTMLEIKRDNDARKSVGLGLKTKSTDIINQVTKLAQRILNPHQNSVSMESLHGRSIFIDSKTGSPGAARSKSPSPVGSPRLDTNSDDEKQRPRRKT